MPQRRSWPGEPAASLALFLALAKHGSQHFVWDSRADSPSFSVPCLFSQQVDRRVPW